MKTPLNLGVLIKQPIWSIKSKSEDETENLVASEHTGGPRAAIRNCLNNHTDLLEYCLVAPIQEH